MDFELTQKLKRVTVALQGFDRVIVAFSGGVDSTLLLKLARQALGRDRVLAVTANSPSLAAADLQEVHRLADELDVRHQVIDTAEVDNPDYRANAANRCYFCKQELFERLHCLAAEQGLSTVLYGAIGDDLRDARPGARAASEYGVRGPLQDAGLSKPEVREAARLLGLSNWNRPQNACLSSRIPHGVEVTPHKLSQVEQAEAELAQLGFRQVRVRHLGDHARVEVGREEVARFHDPALAGQIAQRFAAFGFASVGVSRAGYRAGGANQPADDELLLAAPASLR